MDTPIHFFLSDSELSSSSLLWSWSSGQPAQTTKGITTVFPPHPRLQPTFYVSFKSPKLCWFKIKANSVGW